MKEKQKNNRKRRKSMYVKCRYNRKHIAREVQKTRENTQDQH